MSVNFCISFMDSPMAISVVAEKIKQRSDVMVFGIVTSGVSILLRTESTISPLYSMPACMITSAV